MNDVLMFVIFVLIAGLAVVAKWVRLPYPIAFVFGGISFALVPGCPGFGCSPNWCSSSFFRR
jgi:hypothetical protein